MLKVYAMNGLRAILSSAGTIHTMEMPPERKPRESEQDFAERYDEWYWRMHTWKTSWKAAGR